MSAITYDKDCYGCKIAGGLFLTTYGVYHSLSINWARTNYKERMFNTAMLGVIFGLAGLNYYAAY